MPGVFYVCIYSAMHTDGTVTTLELVRGACAACERVANDEPDVTHLLPHTPISAGHFLVRLAVEWDALMREIPSEIVPHFQAGTA